MTYSSVLKLPASLFSRGRVFTVGDIHGCYDLVQRALEAARFDPAQDTLISVGDLIDRGPNSARCVALLKEPCVHAVLGNHEAMLLDAQADDEAAGHFLVNGGQWWLTTRESVQADILDLLRTLPVAIELPTPRGLAGFVHADVPVGLDWPGFLARLEQGDEKVRQTALWGRKRLHDGDEHGVLGVGRLFVGHTPGRPRRLGNVYPMDTGAVFAVVGDAEDAHLSMANILCSTQEITGGRILSTAAGAARVVSTQEETRPFGDYAKPRT